MINKFMPCCSCGATVAKEIRSHCEDRLHGVSGEWRILECARCGLIYTDPVLSADRILEYYPSNYNPYNPNKSLRSTRLGAVLRGVLMLPYQVRFGNPDWEEKPFGGKRLIDVGCGSGVFLSEAVRQGWQCWGIDFSPFAVAAARRQVPEARIENNTLENLSSVEKFDLINLSHVLEHLTDPNQALRTCYDRLNSDGKLRVIVPNFGGLESRVFRQSWIGLDIPRHLFHFRKSVLCDLLREIGFSDIQVRPAMFASSISESLILALPTGLRRKIMHTRFAHWLYLLAIFPAALSYLVGNSGAIEVTAKRPTTSS